MIIQKRFIHVHTTETTLLDNNASWCHHHGTNGAVNSLSNHHHRKTERSIIMAVKKFDMKATIEGIRQRLKNMQETKHPGEASGTGTKTDILHAMVNDLKALQAKGYTAGQIAEAMSHGDDFSILPKSITQALNKVHEKPRQSRKKKEDVAEQAAVRVKKNERKAAPEQSATFVVTPDSEDL
jgi:hypothetical protein